MLKIRYGAFGKWINATHGDWLDTKKWKVYGMKMKG